MGQRIALRDDNVRFPWAVKLMLMKRDDQGGGHTFTEVMEGDEALQDARRKAHEIEMHLKFLNTDLNEGLSKEMEDEGSESGRDVKWLRNELRETNARVALMEKELGVEKREATPVGDTLTVERLKHMTKAEIRAYAKKYFNAEIVDGTPPKMRGDLLALKAAAEKPQAAAKAG